MTSRDHSDYTYSDHSDYTFKQEDSFKKENYRPVSTLPHMSKVFESILFKQIDTFMTTKFSPYLCGFRKKP